MILGCDKLRQTLQPHNEDQAQALTRIIFAILTYFSFLLLHFGTEFKANKTLLWINLTFLLYSLFLYYHVRHNLRPSMLRRFITLNLDLAMVAYLLYEGGFIAAGVFPIFLWIIISYGMRYGINYFYLSIVMGVFYLLLATHYNHQWHANKILSFSMILGLVVIALFYQKLISRLYRLNTQLQEELQKTKHASLHDPLTTLPNRKYFNTILGEEIQRGRRYNTKFAIVYMDLNDFKPVNDNYGHHFGDILLQEVGKRIQQSLRESDFAARLGGDEFGFLFLHTQSIEEVEQCLKRIHQSICDPYLIQEHRIVIGASYGIAFYPKDGTETNTLLSSADTKMYQNKRFCKLQQNIPPRS